MTPYDHVRLTKFLHNLNPEKYIIEGKFEAFADSRINSVFEEAYMNDQEGENEEEDEDDYDSSNMIVNDSAPIESEEDELDRAEASLRKRRKWKILYTLTIYQTCPVYAAVSLKQFCPCSVSWMNSL